LNVYTVFVLMIVYVASGFVLRFDIRARGVGVIVTVLIGMRMVMVVMDCLAKGMLFVRHGCCLNGSECQRVVHDHHQYEKNFAVQGYGSLLIIQGTLSLYSRQGQTMFEGIVLNAGVRHFLKIKNWRYQIC
tara:strand:- start:374 stop:766 length:393 start_codon:yes stop_codon:yes gene_type:complete